MSQPIVLQLQELASDSDHDIADLLRKALVVATKLQLADFKKWVLSELNGYDDQNTIPEYRQIKGDLRVENPFHGLIPFIINQPEIREIVTKILVHESVSSIQKLTDADENGSICFFFSPEKEAALMQMQGGLSPLRPVRVVGSNQLISILNAVRTRMLEWALSLEAEGIIGDELTFSAQERNLAMTSKTIQIENFQGVLGDVHGGSLSQVNNITVNPGDLSSLVNYLEQNGVPPAAINELEQAVRDDPVPKSAHALGSKVSAWIGKMVGLAASGAWEVSVGTAGSLLAAAVSKFYGL
ncbi:hypothetical protein [Fluviibacter phosphoraccumulans]|uniref:Uncharacterized protein n=1 Tax=Fluviibacter phosphoraccumulans TaxID=1751046 RepID=A0A679IC55_9RHOO|nr:hypothetical protein [Fluviibacter phosphoraccumulans]BBU69320.1 hypothetical protein ICHIAU1_16030 [Fluviibacter phosphoraccumulans]BCA65255.1 hypothetical protein SHINM1_008570 [Fluviibacter phosphoraccumulans]